MKAKLTPIKTFDLTYTQLAELVRQHIRDIKNAKNAIVIEEGSPLDVAVKRLIAILEAFEAYIKNAQKSEFSDLLLKFDLERENRLRAIDRFMKLLQLSDDAEEKEAFRQIDIVWQVHKGLVKEEDKSQTSGIDNLLMDMGAEKLKPFVTTAGITPYLNRVKQSNDAYKAILQDRNAQQSERVVKEGIALRAKLLERYKIYSNLVLTMAQLYGTNEQWNKLLALLNVSRKNFAVLLATPKNPKTKNTEPETPPTSEPGATTPPTEAGAAPETPPATPETGDGVSI